MTTADLASGAEAPVAGRGGAVGSVLRTIDPMTVEVTGDKIVVVNPAAARRLNVGRHVLDLLLEARDGLDATALSAHPTGVVEQLIELGFLVEYNDAAPPPWCDWGPAAWAFHVRARNVPFFEERSPETINRFLETIADRPRPSSLTRWRSDRILLLPRVRTPCAARYTDVLEARRTHRHFEDCPLGLDLFSDMLHYSFAPLRFADAGPLGVLQLKAAAGAGARHETEAYVLVFNVEHVANGLYAYDGVRHGLVPMSAVATRERAEDLTYRQRLFEGAAFGVFTAAVAERMSWKYRGPNAYKIMLQNVGHVAQVFSMTAAALGLGAAITGAMRDDAVDSMLELGSPGEFATFAMACGVPRRHPDGLPLAIRVPESAPDGY